MKGCLRFILIFVLVSVIITGGVIIYQNRPFAAPENAQVVTFDTPALGWLPEGVVWDEAAGSFIVGSLVYGDLSRVALDGTLTPFITDDALLSTAGLYLDRARSRLFVTSSGANAFFGQEGAARLAAYDLPSGERLFDLDLGALAASGRSFANDVTVDEDGNAYVTDSFTPVIYRVTPDGEASILVTDPLLGADFLALNGIVYHPDGFLLAANSRTRSLLRVTLEGEPAVTPVTLSLAFGADGMALDENGTLFAVARDVDNRQFIARATSSDGWQTAEVERLHETDGSATTLALVDGDIAYVNAYLSEFLRRTYQIVQFTPRG